MTTASEGSVAGEPVERKIRWVHTRAAPSARESTDGQGVGPTRHTVSNQSCQ